ncbi:nicotinate-nucleotide adenylyltransferase [Chrysiogenes arsenatis]|uniref:nicotinate-nucleotide adenylyltransferase n=1 Tax=Chrysiogenes arsenatis TaxID=309797 RepID=UPI0003FE78A5|nr:nicotinate-nucleotide adenylyltransferase [Chrysiogenes arsenatis]
MIGLLGGSFSPVHHGHLYLAEYARHTFGLEKVVFLPSGQPAHKEVDLLPAQDRFAMLQLVAQTNPAFEVWDLEMQRAGSTYTMDTLRQLDDPDRYFFITGADIFATIMRWKEYESILDTIRFIVASRPGAVTLSQIQDCVPEWYQQSISSDPTDTDKRCFLMEMPGLEISSTYIRHALRHQLPVRYLLPEVVYQYLKN